MAGFQDRDAIWLAAIPAFGNFLFTLVGLLLVDHLGRRKLLIASMSGVILTLFLLGVSFYVMDRESPAATPLSSSVCDFDSCGVCVGNSRCGFCVELVSDSFVNGTCSQANSEGESRFRPNGSDCGLYFERSNEGLFAEGDWYVDDGSSNGSTARRHWYFNSCPDNRFAPLTIVVLFLYIAFFAPGMGPLPWTVNSEIYPTWARSTAIAIATTVNWLCNLLVSMTFLTFTDSIGQPATFWMYSGLGLLGLAFIVLLVPETKGRKLEEVQDLFQRPLFLQWCHRKRPRPS